MVVEVASAGQRVELGRHLDGLPGAASNGREELGDKPILRVRRRRRRHAPL